jgi:hypothetical protein
MIEFSKRFESKLKTYKENKRDSLNWLCIGMEMLFCLQTFSGTQTQLKLAMHKILSAKIASHISWAVNGK